MTDDRSQRARAAAEAGTATRERQIEEAHKAAQYEHHLAGLFLLGEASDLTCNCIQEARASLKAMEPHLDELARLIAQRDGYAAAQDGRQLGNCPTCNGFGVIYHSDDCNPYDECAACGGTGEVASMRKAHAAAQSIGPDVALPNRQRASMSGEGRWR